MKKSSLVTLLVLFSSPAFAYVGPGLGMGVIGTIFGVLAAIVLAVFGLFWYPLKRRFGNRKAGVDARQTGTIAAEKEPSDNPANCAAAQPECPLETRPKNQVNSHASLPGESRDSATVNRTDNPVP